MAWYRTELLVQWSMPLPTGVKEPYPPPLLHADLRGGGEGSRNGRWSKKGTQAAFSLHSAFPKLQENRALVTSWKDTVKEVIRTL